MQNNSEHSHHFIIPLKYLAGAFVGLLILTVVTVGVTRFDFGSFNIVVALAIAIAKASLVIAIFMGLRWDKGFNIVILLTSILFVIIFFVFTFADFATRGDINPEEARGFGVKSPYTHADSTKDHGQKDAAPAADATSETDTSSLQQQDPVKNEASH